MKNKIKVNKYIIIYLLITFMPRFILIQFMFPLSVPLDELSTLALPAYLAGYDWSSLMGRTRYYYGYGMAVLFTPIFKLIENPVLLYRAVLTACAILQIIPGLITFHILGKFFKQTNKFIKLILSIIASYCVCTAATSVGNEHMLYVIVWILGWMLLELINCKDNQKRRIYTFILVTMSFYGLTCHARSKVFIIAIICIIVLYGLMEKRFLVSPIVFLLMSSLAYKTTTLLTSKVQDTIWPSTNAEATLMNTSTDISLSLLKNKDLWHTWYNIILGQLGTGAVFTGGCLLIAIVFCVFLSVKKITSVWLKYNYVEDNYFYVILFGLLTIGAIIFAQSLTWLVNAYNAVLDSTLSEGGRAFTYLRYYFPCVSMVVVLSLNWLVTGNQDKIVQIILGIALILVVILQLNFIFGIIPLIERTPVLNYIHNAYWVFSFMKDGDWTSKYTFFPACIICMFFYLFFMLFIIKGRKEIALYLLIVLLGYQYIMKGMSLDVPRSIADYNAVQDTCNVFEKMKKDGTLPDYIGINYEWVASTYQPTIFMYQYFLKNHNISSYVQVEGVDEAIYISAFATVPFNGITEDVDTWFKVELTENQYIFFKGDRLQDFFKHNGYDYSLIGTN